MFSIDHPYPALLLEGNFSLVQQPPLVVEPTRNEEPPKKRKQKWVNQDPYGGDALAWEDACMTGDAESGLNGVDDGQNSVQCAAAVDWALVDECDGRRSTAAKRLHQVRRHLSLGSLEAYSTRELNSSGVVHWQQPQHAWTHFPEIIQDRPGSQSKLPPPFDFVLPLHSRQQDSRDRDPMVFHCPFVQCHRNWKNQKYESSFSDQRRRIECVHTGCNYSTCSREQWLEHISCAHHSLQGKQIPPEHAQTHTVRPPL